MFDSSTYKIPAALPLRDTVTSPQEPFDWEGTARDNIKEARRSAREIGASKYFDMSEALINRRKRAVIAFGDQAVERYSKKINFIGNPEESVAKAWIVLNLCPGLTYNLMENDGYLLCGAAIWILDQVTAQPGWQAKLYPILPKDAQLLEGINMPNLWDTNYEFELIMSVVHVLYHRNDDIAPLETDFKGIPRVFTNAVVAEGKQHENVPSRVAYEELIRLIPHEADEKATKNFESLFWKWCDRYFDCVSLLYKDIKKKRVELDLIAQEYNKKREEVRQMQENFRSARRRQKQVPPKSPNANPLMIMRSPNESPISAGTVFDAANPMGVFQSYNRGLSTPQVFDDPRRRLDAELEGLFGMLAKYFNVDDEQTKIKEKIANFNAASLSHGCLDSAECEEIYGPEMTERMIPLTIADPYEMCFALLSLIESGSDYPWVYGAGVGLMREASECLPWGIRDYDELDDTIWRSDSEDDAPSYDEEQPAEIERIAAKKGKVPAIPDWYERKYHPKKSSLIPYDRSLAQIVYEQTGCILPRNLHRYDSLQPVIREYGVTGKSIPSLLSLLTTLSCARRQYIADNLDDQIMQYLFEDSSPSTEESVPTDTQQDDLSLEETTEQLKQAQEENKRLQRILHESNSTIRKLNKELTDVHKAAALDHRELADLREIIFQQSMADETNDADAVVEKNVFPYEVHKDTVVFGGYETWLKALRPLLKGNIRYISKDLVFDPVIIRHADVIWIQTNSLAHKQYYRIIDEARRYQIPVRYFTHASAKKGAIELMDADKTAEL